MDRREFIVRLGTGLIAVPMALSFASCGDDNNDPVTPPVQGFSADSTIDLGHNHSVRILEADIMNPPANGVIYTSTIALMHTHDVILTQQQLTEINNGATVNVTSTVGDGHTHGWAIQKP